jgi:hypothetical protein
VKGTPVEVQGQPMQGGDMQMDGPQDGAPMDLPPGFDKVEALSKSWTKDETSADAVAKGQALIDGLVKAYTTPVAVQDKISLTMKIPGNDQTQELSVGFGPNNSAMLTVPGMQLTRLGDDLYMEVNDAPTKYLKVTKAGTLSEVMASVFGGASMPLPESWAWPNASSLAPPATSSMRPVASIHSMTDSIPNSLSSARMMSDWSHTLPSLSGMPSETAMEARPRRRH